MSRERGIIWRLSLTFLKKLLKTQNNKCYYTGEVFDRISIDRLDSNLPYTESNVVLCKPKVNMMKGSLTLKDFNTLIKKCNKHMKRRKDKNFNALEFNYDVEVSWDSKSQDLIASLPNNNQYYWTYPSVEGQVDICSASIEKDGRIKYTLNNGRTYTCKAGRFLHKLYPELRQQAISEAVEYILGLLEDPIIVFAWGEEIRKYYHRRNYSEKKGVLGNSCMSYEDQQEFLDVYVDNPQYVKLAVSLDEKGLVKARTLIWQNKVYDTIYAISPAVYNALESKLNDYGYEKISRSANLEPMKVGYYEYMPYMDNVSYYNGAILRYNFDEGFTLLDQENGTWE